MLIATLVEVVGYGFRAVGLHENIPEPSTYVISGTLITLAPAAIAASLYQLLAHIILANGRGHTELIMKLGLGLGFGALDVLGYILQAAGKSTYVVRCMLLLLVHVQIALCHSSATFEHVLVYLKVLFCALARPTTLDGFCHVLPANHRLSFHFPITLTHPQALGIFRHAQLLKYTPI